MAPANATERSMQASDRAVRDLARQCRTLLHGLSICRANHAVGVVWTKEFVETVRQYYQSLRDYEAIMLSNNQPGVNPKGT